MTATDHDPDLDHEPTVHEPTILISGQSQVQAMRAAETTPEALANTLEQALLLIGRDQWEGRGLVEQVVRALRRSASSTVKRWFDLTGTVADDCCGAVFEVLGHEQMCVRPVPCPDHPKDVVSSEDMEIALRTENMRAARDRKRIGCNCRTHEGHDLGVPCPIHGKESDE